MLSAQIIEPPEVFRVSRRAYAQLAENGAFDGQRVQLVDGVIISMNSMGSPHAWAVGKLNQLLSYQLGLQRIVRVGLPVAIDEFSEPEPDLAVVSESDTRPGRDHPSTAQLVIEVADSSRSLDLGIKARLYAQASVPEYWVFDLQKAQLVVHRAPKRGLYTKVQRLGPSKQVTSLIAPTVTVAIGEILG